MEKIIINAGGLEIEAELDASVTSSKIIEALPIIENGSLWGDEIYFKIPVESSLYNPSEIVQKGDIAFWPPGSAFCIFFGATPGSTQDEIRPASAVDVIGKITGDYMILKQFNNGDQVKIVKK